MDMQEIMQQLLARLESDREKSKADRIADREYMKQKMCASQDLLPRLEDKIETNREKYRDDLK
jgi:hypothetical protein